MSSAAAERHGAPRKGLVPVLLEGLDLVVFDKDGTLIDFDLMWGGWAEELADRLESVLGRPIRAELHQQIGYDTAARRTIPGSPLAATPMAQLRALTTELVVRLTGRPWPDAAAVVDAAWTAPDPVSLAHPLADLPALFGGLRRAGVAIAVVTSDDRAPTEATLAGLAVAGLVDAVVCADDGFPSKPSPDTILEACRISGVEPGRAAMIGDSIADLQMAGAAGIGRRIGVLSGIGRRSELEPLADILLDSIAELRPG
jgi:phosphoglycolate phosphatase-like HAD superfamily hydrolase